VVNPEITIIIPTFNERDNIVPLVERINKAISFQSYEIIFVDDNSIDGTAEGIRILSTSYPINLVVRKKERGLASAVVEGLKDARGQLIVVMDADLQHPPNVIPKLLKELKSGTDIAVASRYIRGGSVPDWGLLRRIISKGAIFLAHLLLPSSRDIKDPTSGYFAFKKEVIIGSHLKPSGYKILLEILMEGKYENTTEVPFAFSTRSHGESKLTIRQQKHYLNHLFDLMRRKGELNRIIKFLLVGLSGVGVNIGLLWLLTEVCGLYYLVSASISIETSIISNFLLNNYFTFYDRNRPGAKNFFGRLLKFNVISLGGLAINIGVLWLFTELFGLYYIFSNLFGIAAATIWNFTANTWWTWK
jgi:dolichol-phosphate mannosyltransferase